MEVAVKREPSLGVLVVAFAIIYLVWGSTYYFIKVALTGFPPFLLGGLRFTLAAVLMFAWCALRGEKIFIGRSILASAVTGFLLLGIGNGAVIFSERELASSLVAILYTSQPLSFVLLDKPQWKVNITNKWIVFGIILGIAGVLMLFGAQVLDVIQVENFVFPTAALLMVMAGTLAFSAGSIFTKYNPSRGTPAVNIAWQMLTAGILFSLCSGLTGETVNLEWTQIPIEAWGSLIYLTIFGSIIAFSTYIWLLTVRPAVQVSTYAYVNPIVAVILGVCLGNERISFLQMCGLAVILSGVFLINFAKYSVGAKSVAKKGLAFKA